MFGIFGIFIDLALILFGFIFICIGVICVVCGLMPKLVEWMLKLVFNPLFWVILFILVFIL